MLPSGRVCPQSVSPWWGERWDQRVGVEPPLPAAPLVAKGNGGGVPSASRLHVKTPKLHSSVVVHRVSVSSLSLHLSYVLLYKSPMKHYTVTDAGMKTNGNKRLCIVEEFTLMSRLIMRPAVPKCAERKPSSFLLLSLMMAAICIFKVHEEGVTIFSIILICAQMRAGPSSPDKPVEQFTYLKLTLNQLFLSCSCC